MVALILTLVQSNIAILIGSVLSGSACAAGTPADSNATLKTAALTAPDNKLFIFGLPVAPAFGPGDALPSRRILGRRRSSVMRSADGNGCFIPPQFQHQTRSWSTPQRQNWSTDVDLASERIERKGEGAGTAADDPRCLAGGLDQDIAAEKSGGRLFRRNEIGGETRL